MPRHCCRTVPGMQHIPDPGGVCGKKPGSETNEIKKKKKFARIIEEYN